MANASRIILTTSAIQRNIIKLTKVINELEYYRKGYGRSNWKAILGEDDSYFQSILTRANRQDGVPCFKCREMIEPGSDCMAKYRNNNLVPITKHYHMDCFESLYH